MSVIYNTLTNFNDNLKDNKGRPYFFKDAQKKLKYIIPESIKTEEITHKDNIVTTHVVDTEFSEFVGNLAHITLEELALNKNKFLLQKNLIDNGLQRSGYHSFDDIIMSKVEKTTIEKLNSIENIKQQPYLHLTTQHQHVLYPDDASILINPAVQPLYQKYVQQPYLQYTSYVRQNGFHTIDHLQLRGFDVSLKRLDSTINDKELLQTYESMKREDQGKLKTCTFKIYAYWLNADLIKIYDGYFREDVLTAQRKGDIKLHRRITSSGTQNRWRPKWLITINGLVYRVAFDYADLGALQGAISYSAVLENLGMDNNVKKSLDSVKNNMLFAMLKYPEEFKKYALDDLNIYEALKKHNKLLYNVYKDLKVESFFDETKLTTGATVNDLQTAILLKKLGYTNKTDEGMEELSSLTKIASSKNMKSYDNISYKKADGIITKRRESAKTAGGRCYNNLHLIHMTTTSYSICDIDMTSAYTTIGSSESYRFGNPVILCFNKGMISLKQFLKRYEHLMDKRGYKLIVETVDGELLDEEQDLLVSFPFMRKKSKIWYDVLGDLQLKNSIDLKNIPTAIYPRELHNTPISYDDLNIIRHGMTKKQGDDILNKAKMVCAVFYPKGYECKNLEELREKIAQHKIEAKGRFNYTMNGHVQIDNEEGKYPHYWYKTNFGQLLLDTIIQRRRDNKKTNPSLAYLFKLIGNTVYGNNVSSLFDTSNLILASNITAMCRAGMWCVEKALNASQTITDGGVCELNEVIHRVSGRLDTPLLVRSYLQDKSKMSKYRKWHKKPITKNGNKIVYTENEGWLMDDVFYPYNKTNFIIASDNYKTLELMWGKDHVDTKKSGVLLDDEMVGLKKLMKQINVLVIAHVRKTFPKVELFNGIFNKCETDEYGIAEKDIDGNYIYEEVIGLFEFEVKNLCSKAIFHGSADYLYINTADEKTIKMRGYDHSKDITSIYLQNNRLEFDDMYYLKDTPVDMFLTSLQTNSEAVPIPRPYIKPCILKPAGYRKDYHCTWSKSHITAGSTYYKVVTIPIHSLRYKFLTYKQHLAWVKYEKELKRKNGGLGFEVFYINQDGTINYKKMVEEIDYHIRNGVMFPRKVFDKNMNFYRDLKYIKNKHVQETIYNHISLVNTGKRYCRGLIIGAKELQLEDAKKSCDDGTVIMRKIPKYIKTEHHDFYEHVNKYSNDNEYRDIELRFDL
jgi:hypothetical protein